MRNKILLSMAALGLTVSLLFSQASPPAAKIPAGAGAEEAALKASPRHGEWVDIAVPGTQTKVKSWVVYPERPDKAGVVIVIFEIFGMTDWVRGVTDQLAADGFIAIAPDLLSGMGPNGGGSEALGQNVGQTIRTLTPDLQVTKLDAVREYALKIPAANGKIGSIGFCWGGGASFNYAARQSKLNAAVVYYGTPPSDDLLAKVECPVLGCYGGNDARITATVEPTTKKMTDLKKSYEPHVYEGAGHGFLRQQNAADSPNMKAAQSAWPTTVAFFKKHLS